MGFSRFGLPLTSTSLPLSTWPSPAPSSDPNLEPSLEQTSMTDAQNSRAPSVFLDLYFSNSQRSSLTLRIPVMEIGHVLLVMALCLEALVAPHPGPPAARWGASGVDWGQIRHAGAAEGEVEPRCGGVPPECHTPTLPAQQTGRS
jgi:hypothetical protein